MTVFQFTAQNMQMMEFSQSEEDLRGFAVADSGNNFTMEGRKESGRKKKADTAEKLKELHSDVSDLVQSEAEAVGLVAVLQHKGSAPESMAQGKASKVQELQAQLVVKDQEIQMLEAELQTRTQEMSEKLELVNQLSCTAVSSTEPQALLQEKKKQVSELLNELAGTINSLELQRKKNSQLQEKNCSTTEALSATESVIREKLSIFQKLHAQLIAKDQEIHKLQTALETRTEELTEKIELLNQQSCAAVPSADLQTFFLEKKKQVSELQNELAITNSFLERQRIRNSQLRETNWRAMEALSATHSMVQGKLGKVQELQAQLVVKNQEIQMLQVKLEKRTQELSETIQPGNKQSCRAVPSTELQTWSLEKQVSDLQKELATMNNSLDFKKRKNNQLREKNLSAMEALSARESVVQGKLRDVHKLQGQVVVKDQKIQVQQDELETRTQELVNQTVPSPEAQTLLLEKHVSDLQKELAEPKGSVEPQRKKNTELQEENCVKLEALSATESLVQGKPGKLHELQALLVVKDQTIQMLQDELETTTKKLRENTKLAKQNFLTHQYLHQSFRLWFLRRRIRCWICRTSFPRQKTRTLSFRRNAVGPWKLFQPQPPCFKGKLGKDGKKSQIMLETSHAECRAAEDPDH